jgi:hypothetical protein
MPFQTLTLRVLGILASYVQHIHVSQKNLPRRNQNTASMFRFVVGNFNTRPKE